MKKGERTVGSTGYGNFENYRVPGSKGGQSGSGGANANEVECPEVIDNIKLEDVATSEFYIKNNRLPNAGSNVHLRVKIHQGRLVVESSNTHEIIGNLPTHLNNLVNCINSGLAYDGTVLSSGTVPIPFVVVRLYVK